MIHVIARNEGDHLVPLQDTLLDPEIIDKARIALEQKINVLFGVQKEVVELPAAHESLSQPVNIVEEHSVGEEKQEAEKVSKKKKEEKLSAKQAAKKGRRGQQDVSLDDIAHLFR